MHEIRQALRGKAVVLMGKNTMVRRALKGFIADFPEYERLLPHVKGIFLLSLLFGLWLTMTRQCGLHLHQ
jgi:ribosomal protein L10